MVRLDLSALPPARRLAALLDGCDALTPGATLSFELDRDPSPLYYALDRLRPGLVEWHYLRCGPDGWTVQVRRVGRPAPTAGPNPSGSLGNS